MIESVFDFFEVVNVLFEKVEFKEFILVDILVNGCEVLVLVN